MIDRIRELKRKLKKHVVSKFYYTKPAFIILGAQKAGTTALFRYLYYHPQIIVPDHKELHFFNREDVYDEKRLHLYHVNFPYPHTLRNNKITFEATPDYLDHPACAKRIFSYNPDIKLIISLRDPVKRAYSAWNMYRSFQATIPELTEYRTFEEAIDYELKEIYNKTLTQDRKKIVQKGIYHMQIRRFLKYFSEEQLFIYENRELNMDHNKILKQITDFLGLDSFEFSRLSATNKGRYENPMSKECEVRLKEFYSPHNTQLFQLIGKRFEWNY